MPELPDVERFKRALTKNALRKSIDRVVVSDARILGKLSVRAFASRLQGAKAHRSAPARQAPAGRRLTWRLADLAFRHDRRA